MGYTAVPGATGCSAKRDMVSVASPKKKEVVSVASAPVKSVRKPIIASMSVALNWDSKNNRHERSSNSFNWDHRRGRWHDRFFGRRGREMVVVERSA